jgi:sugar/nucleoside kinase (ribokinase family)
MQVTVFGAISFEPSPPTLLHSKGGRRSPAERPKSHVGGHAGAQSICARMLGSSVRLVGGVGDDLLGRLVVRHVASIGVNVDGVRPVGGAHTCNRSRSELLSDGSYGRHVINGNVLLNADWVDQDCLSDTDVLLLGLSTPGGLIESVAGRARKLGVLTVASAGGLRKCGHLPTGCLDWITTEADELDQLCSVWNIFGIDPMDRCKLLARRLCVGIACNLGQEGAMASTPAGKVVATRGKCPPERSEMSGSAFNAAFALSLISTSSLTQALALGQQVASTARYFEAAAQRPGLSAASQFRRGYSVGNGDRQLKAA